MCPCREEDITETAMWASEDGALGIAWVTASQKRVSSYPPFDVQRKLSALSYSGQPEATPPFRE